MRQIVLDTETTGLETGKGHRVIEIGCIELRERRRTGERFHCYLNPGREIDRGALEVHGIDDAFLRDKPRFADVAQAMLDFIGDAELVIHNAAFDLGFLDHELALAGRPERIATRCQVLDTLSLARERFPGQRNSLDALCRRFGVDASMRDVHGALLDASLLTEVYLALSAGQGDLGFASDAPATAVVRREVDAGAFVLRVQRANAQELAAHRVRLELVELASRRECAWLREQPAGEPVPA
ncbi:MAG TPA: DNA polymerase III subunit epsilon [Candidatus Saccharimonadia bacterium]|nr:DNA polymerase III subunit epsilon [Candidatus Saccharimonadia bacterium]